MIAPANHEERLDAWLALTGQTNPPADPVELPLLTGSMAPVIPVGALLSIDAQTGTEYQSGDVAIFLVDDELIAHRILLVLRAGPWHWVLEKGDNNLRGCWRRGSDLRGRVLGFTIAGEAPRGNPADSVLASRGLRRHLRHWLLDFGRHRTTDESPGS